ncbi:hypothetical protein PRIPAC_76392 [Pristionchus pacificus]|uniref:Phosphotransferase n=1 Tax=Pristionchus pacificus TaxID=54126 RepID=A0A2A6BGN1_PRIPA|nr:hypothetical protein PRIPAC_76392 [Pristionchus pacificus]|eukprot:PDM65042.1 phosphotransferase [Pristionchus pacificus]
MTTATAKSKDQDVENSAMGKFRMGRILGERWRIVQKLDEGGFGSVYKVQNVKDPKSLAALKVEPASSDEWNHLKLETAVLKELHGNGIRAHVPQLFRSAKRRSYCYMIITLLGENLRRLKERHFPRGMPLRTWTRVGVQCLYGIKTMHDRGYVHRDIKPQNFVLGYGATPAYARVVYIIDFGLSRNYAFPPTANCKRWIARRARARLEFRGTYRYASPTMHEEKEQGRKDDLWSWLYLMIDLYCGLPWTDDDNKTNLEKKKLHMKDEDLMIRMPEEIKFIPKYLRKLNVYQRPNYVNIYRALETLRKASKTSYEDSYEWEGKEEAIANKKSMRDKQAPIGYTNAEAFFKSDPIRLKAAPSMKDEQIITDRYIVKKAKPEMITLEDVSIGHLSEIRAETIARKNYLQFACSTTLSDRQENMQNREILLIQEKKTGETPPNTPPPTTPPTPKSPGKRDRKKPPCRRVSPSSSNNKTSNKTSSTKSKEKGSKRSRISKREGGSLEESDDFVPSCYMNFDIPLHYLQSPNEDPKEFQKKVVGMDWGHVEPPKQLFKDAVPPMPRQPTAAAIASSECLQQPPTAAVTSQEKIEQKIQQDQPSLILPQQENSGGNSDNSQGPPSNRSAEPSRPSSEQSAEKAASISPTCSAACTVKHSTDNIRDDPTAIPFDGAKKELEQQPSSNSSKNSSVSLTTEQPRTKRSS